MRTYADSDEYECLCDCECAKDILYRRQAKINESPTYKIIERTINSRSIEKRQRKRWEGEEGDKNVCYCMISDWIWNEAWSLSMSSNQSNDDQQWIHRCTKTHTHTHMNIIMILICTYDYMCDWWFVNEFYAEMTAQCSRVYTPIIHHFLLYAWKYFLLIV